MTYGTLPVAPSPLFGKGTAQKLLKHYQEHHHHHDDDSDDESLLSPEELLARAQHFSMPHDAERGYRATQLHFCSFRRPHMRAFHGSWICNFVSLFVQFSIPPLLPELKQALELSKAELWSSNIYSMVGGVFSRFLLGPLSDQYGAKLMVTLLLAFMAIPCALTGLLVSFAGLCLVRLVIGSLDNSVPCQYWITCHFVRDRSGSAMALSSGLAAMGSCLVQPILGSLVFPLCVALVVDHDMAWRLALVVPALLAIATASFFFRYSEDCPLGSYHEIKSAGLMTERSAMDSFRSGALNLNSWILCLQFGASAGVDFTMCNGAAIYYHERFQQSTAFAGAVAGLYGISALFARGLGGWWSDVWDKQLSMRGRLLAQLVSMLLQGLLTIAWARLDSFGPSVIMMMVFSVLVQISIGTCFAIVPYVDGPNTGSVAGIVGAGGNVGAIILGLKFRNSDYESSAEYMGWFTIALALLTPLVVVRGYRGLVFGRDDANRRQNTLLIPPAAI